MIEASGLCGGEFVSSYYIVAKMGQLTSTNGVMAQWQRVRFASSIVIFGSLNQNL